MLWNLLVPFIFFPHYLDNGDGSQLTLIAQQNHKVC